jgi:hypothetical protein
VPSESRRVSRSGRDELLEAIDELARSAHGGDHNRIERRRLRARTLAALLVPPPLDPYPCECGIGCGTPERLAEHRHYVHDGPRPDHWLDDDRPQP